MNQHITLESLETELRGLYAGLGVLIEECYMEGAGRRMLGLEDEMEPSTLAWRVNVRNTRLGKMLPVWFKYGFQGVLSAGFDLQAFDQADGPFERLGDVLGLLRMEDDYFEWCLMGAGANSDDAPQGHLAELVKRVSARLSLDRGEPLTIADLAVLADMNERSVRNAVTADGEGRLAMLDGGHVSNEEARRWLKGRRGFVPTQLRALPSDITSLPDALDDVEIPGFVRSRLKQLLIEPKDSSESMATGVERPMWLVRAARVAMLPVERLECATRLPLDIRPEECEGLAKALEVDPVWFTYQVMVALYPKQVDMLLNPKAWRAAEVPAASEPAPQSVAVELTASMLTHGYIDLPASAKQLFPDDCFGSRKEGDEGGQVELVYGPHRAMSDIRIKSAKTISPRRRFTSWLNTELGAKPGDRIRVEKTGERTFALTHIPG